jgi:hypothetical protein
MYALGRLGNDQLIEQCAKHICEHKLKSREAIAFIRSQYCEYRPSNADALVSRLATIIDDYHRTHRADWHEVESALIALLDTIRQYKDDA